MSEVLAKLTGVNKVYQKGKERVEVLHSLDLEIPQGDFIAIMGPSGSGKTTLLNLLGGLDQPTEGSIEVAGERIDRLSGGELARWRADHVGFVFQLYNLLPVLTAERNVELPLLLTHLSKAERRKHVATALKVVGLADHLERRHRLPQAVLLEMGLAVAPDGELQVLRQGVHHRDPYAVQAAGHLVRVVVELPAGVQDGHDDLGRGALFLGVFVDRDAAPVVADAD